MTAGKYVSSRDDPSSFGTWTVGRQGTVVLGFGAPAGGRRDHIHGAA
jgi:hypothetical protein